MALKFALPEKEPPFISYLCGDALPEGIHTMVVLGTAQGWLGGHLNVCEYKQDDDFHSCLFQDVETRSCYVVQADLELRRWCEGISHKQCHTSLEL